MKVDVHDGVCIHCGGSGTELVRDPENPQEKIRDYCKWCGGCCQQPCERCGRIVARSKVAYRDEYFGDVVRFLCRSCVQQVRCAA